MALRVVGAGVGRTGTNSLKVALEHLLGGRCYHMFEVRARPQDVPSWQRVFAGEPVDLDALMSEFTASVDWPAAACWRELAAANPDAPVLLSTRDSAEAWWASMERTIVPALSRPLPPEDLDEQRRRAMIVSMMQRFTPEWPDGEAMMLAYERHNAAVRREVPAERLVEWRPGAGWEPLCAALGLPVPPEPFPHENSTAKFRSAMGLDGQSA